MYVTVNIATGLAQRYITLPRTTVTFNAFGSTVYRVESNGQDEKGKPKLIAKQSFVTTGDTRGDQIAILTGVNEGDTIVTTGQIKLRTVHLLPSIIQFNPATTPLRNQKTNNPS